MRSSALLMAILFVITLSTSMQVVPVAAQEPGGGGNQRAFFEVDQFTYRAAFELEDGTEAVLLRSSYRINFLYQHHQPTLNEHYYSVSMGFFFGKTLLGRPVVQNMTFDEIAFYPKWRDSSGYYHDLLDDTPIFSVSGTMKDGRIFGGYMLIDDDAISQYIPMFGGYLVFDGLRITLVDGSIIDYSASTITIELEKHSNEVFPRNATLSGSNIDYHSEDGYIHINTFAPAQPIFIIDLILGLSLMSTMGVVVVLGLLHVRGRIELPIHRMRRLRESDTIRVN